MDLSQLKQILALAREHNLAELEIEEESFRVRIRREFAPAATAPPRAAPQAIESAAVTGRVPATPVRPDDDTDVVTVKSPIVGTFYRSPEPAAPPFVEVGATVRKGQVLCIIEAMKLMNEIDSDIDGEVIEAFVESGQPVQYGERLFAIRRK
jgi:acetyl-CoA carboxylase biotin carboxyl carrier protein